MAGNREIRDGRRLSAADLMDGPRGRRLVLEYARLAMAAVGGSTAASSARDSADRFHESLFYASHFLDPHPGTIFTVGSPPESSLGAAVRKLIAESPEHSQDPQADGHRLAAECGALLSRLVDRLPRPTAGVLSEAWGIAINAARYWQLPDGYDLAAENPRLAAALGRVAERLVDSGLLEHWDAPYAASAQFTVEFAEDDEAAAGSRATAGSRAAAGSDDEAVLDEAADPDTADAPLSARGAGLRWWEETVDAEAREQRERDRPLGTCSGEWWSTPSDLLVSTTGPYPLGPGAQGARTAPTGLYLVEDDSGPERARVAPVWQVDGTPAVYEVHGPTDWIALAREFPLDVTASRRHDWFNATGREGRWIIPDWHLVAGRYAGVHVSLAGYLRTAGRALAVDGLGWLPDAGGKVQTGVPATVMAGWDPDRTYWLRDAVAPGAPSRDWLWDDEGDVWTPRLR